MAQSKTCTFKKRKWEKSENYRYEIVKCKSFFVMLKGKTKQEVIDILGTPDLIDKNNVDVFTYCLDKEKVLKYDDEKKKQVCCSCVGSLIVLYFENEKVWEVTRVHVD